MTEEGNHKVYICTVHVTMPMHIHIIVCYVLCLLYGHVDKFSHLFDILTSDLASIFWTEYVQSVAKAMIKV